MFHQERNVNSMGLPIKQLQSHTDYSTQTEDTPTKAMWFTCHKESRDFCLPVQRQVSPVQEREEERR